MEQSQPNWLGFGAMVRYAERSDEPGMDNKTIILRSKCLRDEAFFHLQLVAGSLTLIDKPGWVFHHHATSENFEEPSYSVQAD